MTLSDNNSVFWLRCYLKYKARYTKHTCNLVWKSLAPSKLLWANHSQSSYADRFMGYFLNNNNKKNTTAHFTLPDCVYTVRQNWSCHIHKHDFIYAFQSQTVLLCLQGLSVTEIRSPLQVRHLGPPWHQLVFRWPLRADAYCWSVNPIRKEFISYFQDAKGCGSNVS